MDYLRIREKEIAGQILDPGTIREGDKRTMQKDRSVMAILTPAQNKANE
jgi:hypothetical protein